MKKRILFVITISLLFISSTVFAGVTLRYYNKDSGSHSFRVKICGSSSSVTFGGSRTASTTIQGCSNATIYSNCGSVSVRNGDRVEIRNGCVKVQ